MNPGLLNLSGYSGDKFYQFWQFQNAETQAALLFDESSCSCTFKDSEGNVILALTSQTSNLVSGMVTDPAKPGTIEMAILPGDYTLFPINKPVNFDIKVDFTNNPELNPAKPLRGNFTLQQGETD